MSTSTRVLVVRPSKAPFIEEDIALLRKHYVVRTLDVFEKRQSFLTDVKVFLRLLRGVLWADVTYSWFAEIYALWAVRLSKLLMRKSVVVVGGYDVARVPEIDYGKLIDPREAKQVRYTIDHADRVLTVSDRLKQDAIENAGARGDNIRTLPTGYDAERFSPSGAKDTVVLTVALCDDIKRVRVKGIDVFAEVAKRVPHARFVAVGIGDGVRNEVARDGPQNLELTPALPQEETIRYYREAKVYCQLSMREGLPNALCEAMLCECVPVVSDVGGMPEAVGDAGFIVRRDDLDAVADTVERALVSDAGVAARRRIETAYSRARREEALVSIINGLITKKKKRID